MKISSLLVFLCWSTLLFSQVKGVLLHEDNTTEEGYITFKQQYGDFLYFTLDQDIENVKVYASEISGFIADTDTFKVLHNFYVKTGILKTHYPIGFVKSVIEDSVSLYLHQHISQKRKNTGDIAVQIPDTLENYFLKINGKLISIRKSQKQFQEQVSQLFKLSKRLHQSILEGKYHYTDIDTIVKIYNEELRQTTTP